MDKTFYIATDEFPKVSLRSIGCGDQENLRAWKNANRRSFFFQEMITPAMQARWYEAYRGRPDDFMFIVRAEGEDLGCLGVRRPETGWDLYNIIAALPAFSGKGHMGRALRMLCSFALLRFPAPITAKVLASNPALAWYLKNHFVIFRRHPDHVEIALDQAEFRACRLSIGDGPPGADGGERGADVPRGEGKR